MKIFEKQMSEVNMKKLLSIILGLSMLIGISAGIYAAQPATNSPQWTNISTMVSGLSFSGTNGTASGSVDAKSGVTKIEGTLTVFRWSGNSWVYVNSNSGTTTTDDYLILSVNFSGISGVEYKSVFHVAVTRNGIVETEDKYNYDTCP